MSDKQIKNLNLVEIEQILSARKVLVAPEDTRNPVVIAFFLELIGLEEIEVVETGYYNGVDQSKMITRGQIIQPVAFGQQVMQAISLEEEQ